MNTDYYQYVMNMCISLVTTMCNFIPKEIARNCNLFRKHECSKFLLTNNLMCITITLIGCTVPARHGSFYAYDIFVLLFITTLQDTVLPQSRFDQRSPLRIMFQSTNTPTVNINLLHTHIGRNHTIQH